MNYREFRTSRGITVRDASNALHKVYSGIDAFLYIKAEYPEKYGVQLTKEAEWLLHDSFENLPCNEPYEDTPRDTHRLKERVSCRVATGSKSILLAKFKADGFKDMNEGMNHLINQYIKGDK